MSARPDPFPVLTREDADVLEAAAAPWGVTLGEIVAELARRRIGFAEAALRLRNGQQPYQIFGTPKPRVRVKAGRA